MQERGDVLRQGGPGFERPVQTPRQLFLVRNPQQCGASRVNDGYMPVVPHCNGDQIRQLPISALACEFGRARRNAPFLYPRRCPTTDDPNAYNRLDKRTQPDYARASCNFRISAELPEKSATATEPELRISRSSYVTTRSYTPVPRAKSRFRSDVNPTIWQGWTLCVDNKWARPMAVLLDALAIAIVSAAVPTRSASRLAIASKITTSMLQAPTSTQSTGSAQSTVVKL